MKMKKHIGMAMMVGSVLAATSCTDFDDYNNVNSEDSTTSGLASSNLTSWENILQNPQLTTFAELVKKSGFDQDLNQTHYYTIWAPKDGTYKASDFENLDSKALLKKFVRNHVADYGHPATGQVDERVLMLNQKTYNFVGSGNNYMFDGVSIDPDQANLPSSNGVIHLLNGLAAYYPNVYEFITDTVEAKKYGVDSLSRYFLKYETVTLNEEKSVAGSIVNGMQTYVDSVMDTSNALWKRLGGQTDSEDSTFTFLMPTNRAWEKGIDQLKKYYNYVKTTTAQNYVTSLIESTRTIDPVFWQDSMVVRHLTRYLTYSNKDLYNRWLNGEPSDKGVDTIRASYRDKDDDKRVSYVKLSNPKEILSHTIETVPMSNGVGYVIDSLAVKPWETYAPELNAAATNNVLRVLTGNSQRVQVDFPDPEKVDLSETNDTRYTYLWVEPTGSYSKPELDIMLPHVLSTTYEIYCVFVPENVDTRKPTAETLPNRVIFELSYCDENGKLHAQKFLDESEENINKFQAEFNLADNATNSETIRAFSNDTSKVDTVFVGEFTFPVCYYGLEERSENTVTKYCPNIKITTPFSAFNTTLMKAFTRDLRIAGILLKPKELVEVEQSNKE